VQTLYNEIIGLPRTYPGLAALRPQVVYLVGCRQFNQFCCTWRALVDPDTFCPFCPTELERRERTPLRVCAGWMVLENEFPRPDVEKMLLIVPKRHLLSAADLTDEDGMNIVYLWTVCMRELDCAGGAFIGRFGDPRVHAGTVPHIHANVIVPRRESGMSVPLAKLVDGEYGHREDYARLRQFASILDGRGVEWLFSEEGVRETQPAIART